MKSFTKLGLALACGLLPLAAMGSPGKAQAPVDKIFIPNGFDDNDNVEVILHGDFTNSCSRIANTDVAIDQENMLITVDATYYQYGAPDEKPEYCAQVILPYVEVVKLGVLEKGLYTVQLKSNPNVNAELDVRRAQTESPDDYLYAPVDNAWLDVDPTTGKQALVLQGSFPHWFIGCQVIKDVRVEKQNDILVVLPITEVVDEPFCDSETYDNNFTLRKGLSSAFNQEGLLHVRTMHSHSVNRYVPGL